MISSLWHETLNAESVSDADLQLPCINCADVNRLRATKFPGEPSRLLVTKWGSRGSHRRI